VLMVIAITVNALVMSLRTTATRQAHA